MKIISNGELYVRKNDIEYLSQYDENFPLELAIDHLLNEQENKYIRITDLKQIEYLLAQKDVLDFNLLAHKKPADIKILMLKLKM